jgi:hypothetical protein
MGEESCCVIEMVSALALLAQMLGVKGFRSWVRSEAHWSSHVQHASSSHCHLEFQRLGKMR